MTVDVAPGSDRVAAPCLVLLEVGLRAIGDRLPTWITTPRRNLGEVSTDPRWQDSASYGPRLAPRVNTFCEWHQGDIVRMGFLPPASFATLPTASRSSPMPTAFATPNRSRRPPWWRPWEIPSPTA